MRNLVINEGVSDPFAAGGYFTDGLIQLKFHSAIVFIYKLLKLEYMQHTKTFFVQKNRYYDYPNSHVQYNPSLIFNGCINAVRFLPRKKEYI